jgi:hypothetical protein
MLLRPHTVARQLLSKRKRRRRKKDHRRLEYEDSYVKKAVFTLVPRYLQIAQLPEQASQTYSAIADAKSPSYSHHASSAAL